VRIVINALSTGAGGGRAYLAGLLGGLQALDSVNQYVIITPSQGANSLGLAAPNFTVHRPRIPRGILFRLLWGQLSLPLLLQRWKADVVYSPGNYGPLVLPKSCISVVKPENMAPLVPRVIRKDLREGSFRVALYEVALRVLTVLALKRADAVIAPSVNCAEHVRSWLRLTCPISVIYHGRDSLFRSVGQDPGGVNFPPEWGIQQPYVLTVSHVWTYKNLIELIQAFGQVKTQRPGDLKLVIVGAPLDRNYYRKVVRAVRQTGMEGQVRFLGRVARESLPALYSHAAAFVFTSTCENCPVTLLEAMACGAPIACSNVPPMPELCGDAAIYFDPWKVEEIRDALLTLLDSPELAERMRRRALERVQAFQWRRTAEQTLEAFRMAVGAAPKAAGLQSP
jgi:glycosyltransferase involved in cell wall biosynthesis